MTTLLDKIKTKINNKIKTEQLLIIDNSNLHKKHKSFNSNKFHFRIIIKSKKLKNMKKIDAHRIIFSILSDEIKSKIHALEIIITCIFKYFVLLKTF